MAKIDPSLVITGLGSIGRRHLHNLRSLGCTNIILYRTGKGTLADEEFLDFPVEYNLESALSYHPKGVIISNPTALHMPVAIKAARAGCHLFLEKPISHTLNGVHQLQREMEIHNICVLVGFQFRFHPALQQIKTWLDTGIIGKVISANAHWGEYLPGWHLQEDYRKNYSARADLGGGVVFTLSHPFDYLRWLIGEVVSVSAMTAQLSGLDVDVEDTAQVILRFAGGAIGSVYLDYAECPPAHWFNIIGQKGIIRWDSADGVAHVYSVEAGEWKSFSPLKGFGRNVMFMEEMRHFLNCISGKEKPLCTLHDGIRALEIALAAKRSADEKKEINI